MPMYITEGTPYRPEGIMWLELPSELIIGWTLLDPAAPGPSFADTLRQALRSPAAGPPRRPTRVRVADETLAAEARAALADDDQLEGRTEVVVAPTPEIAELVRTFAESLPEGDEPESYLEDGRVPAAAVRGLFRAAETLYRAAPWKLANDGQLVRLDVPETGIAGAAISIIGALGESLGFVVFPTLDAFDAYVHAAERLERDRGRGRVPRRLDPGTDVLSLTFGRATDLPRSMRKEVMTHGWPVAGPEAYPRILSIERDGVLRPLQPADVRLVTACADALTAFVLKHRELFAGTSSDPASESYTGETDLTVRLTAPYEAFALFEDGPPTAPDPWAAFGDAQHIGRNDPCPCGSGKKYKRCHLGADRAAGSGGAARSGSEPPAATAALHELDGRLASGMASYARERFGEAWLRFTRDFADAEATSQLSLHWSLYHLRVRGRRVVDRFLEERGDRLTREERAWLEAQSRAWLGIWEVQEAEPGASLDLEDLLTGERRHVLEASASRTLARREAVLARVVDHEGLSLICGTHPSPLPPLAAAEVVRVFRARLRRARSPAVERLRDESLGRDLIAHWEAACAALAERARIPPTLQNTDGDELVFVTDRYDFDPAAQAEVETKLAGMEGVVAPEADAPEREYIFHRKGGDHRHGWEDLIVGSATVGDGDLTVETNSLPRADALRRRLEAACGDLLRHRKRERRSAEKLMRDAEKRGGEPRSNEPVPPEAQEVLREMKERHYADWADRPLPALGGKTARAAARSARGREQVDALLKDIEHSEATLPAAERFDVSALRRALGL